MLLRSCYIVFVNFQQLLLYSIFNMLSPMKFIVVAWTSVIYLFCNRNMLIFDLKTWVPVIVFVPVEKSAHLFLNLYLFFSELVKLSAAARGHRTCPEPRWVLCVCGSYWSRFLLYTLTPAILHSSLLIDFSLSWIQGNATNIWWTW